jgi:hypothetical protein
MFKTEMLKIYSSKIFCEGKMNVENFFFISGHFEFLKVWGDLYVFSYPG